MIATLTETYTETEFQPAQARARRRWFRFRWWKLLVLSLMLVVCGVGIGLRAWDCGLPMAWVVDYDKARYNEIYDAIEADPQHLLGARFDEVSNELRLDHVPWDDIATQVPMGKLRMYHFRGFRLYVTLMLLPQGITPSVKQWNTTPEELERHGVLWLAPHPPFVLIDGIQTQRERMEQYWKQMDEMCRQMNAEMERKRREGSQ